MLTINGAMGEGGGQILRSAVALSLCTGVPFRIENIRKNRKKPGLRPQHLVAVNAARQIANAEVSGTTVGSQELVFVPRAVVPGDYRFAIGTAGSTTLVLQTLLPALLTAPQPSSLVLEGGTHNPLAPPFEYLDEVFLPVLNCMGPGVSAILSRYGFYPKGGGIVEVRVIPAKKLKPLDIQERGEIEEVSVRSLIANLPEHIAFRELHTIGTALGLEQTALHPLVIEKAHGSGNILLVTIKCQYATEIITAFGERGVMAETVAMKAVAGTRRYLDAGVPVGEYLADQLLLPLALSGGGSYVTLKPSLHTLTNIEVIRTFMNINIVCAEIGEDRWRITVG